MVLAIRSARVCSCLASVIERTISLRAEGASRSKAAAAWGSVASAARRSSGTSTVRSL